MDPTIVEWLRSNELTELHEVFERHKINTMRRLRNLSDELLKELVPEVGLRADLAEPLAALRRADDESSAKILVSTPIQNSPVVSLDFDDSMIVDEEGRQLSILHVSETPQVKRRKLNLPKHILSYESFQALQSLDLRHALEQDIVTSNAILEANEAGGLTDSGRNLIVTAAVKHLLRINNKPESKEYLCLAAKICEIFPHESEETYYIPGDPGRNATGKLPNKVKNLKYTLGRKGDKYLKSTLSFPNTKTQSVSVPAELEGSSDPEDESVQEALLVLKHHSLDSWPDILRHWSTTHPLRRVDSDHRDSLKSTLKTPNGHLLVAQDFKELFPGRENCLIAQWENHRAPIIKLIRKEVSRNDTASLHLLNSLDATQTAKQDALILALLPVLCCKKGRGNTSTPSPPIAVIRNSFFLHIKVSGDIKRELENHQRSLSSRGLQFQPTILAVGPSLNDINAWYVQIEDIRYHLRTAVAALDVCFKAFFALQLEFPKDVLPVWLFIQKYFFNMNMQDDLYLSRVTSVISSLKGFVSKVNAA